MLCCPEWSFAWSAGRLQKIPYIEFGMIWVALNFPGTTFPRTAKDSHAEGMLRCPEWFLAWSAGSFCSWRMSTNVADRLISARKGTLAAWGKSLFCMATSPSKRGLFHWIYSQCVAVLLRGFQYGGLFFPFFFVCVDFWFPALLSCFFVFLLSCFSLLFPAFPASLLFPGSLLFYFSLLLCFFAFLLFPASLLSCFSSCWLSLLFCFFASPLLRFCAFLASLLPCFYRFFVSHR